MINRLTDPTSGRIRLDDRDVASIRPAELRRGMGYVIQQAGLFPHKTVIDNIATVPLLLGQRKRKARARALDLLERVGLPAEAAGRYPAPAMPWTVRFSPNWPWLKSSRPKCCCQCR